MLIKVVNKHKPNTTRYDIYIGKGSILGNSFTSMDISKKKQNFNIKVEKNLLKDMKNTK